LLRASATSDTPTKISYGPLPDTLYLTRANTSKCAYVFWPAGILLPRDPAHGALVIYMVIYME